MTRTKAISSAVVGVVLATCLAGQAHAGFFLEPEIGMRAFSADWQDLEPGFEGNMFGPGVTLGVNLGYMVTPVFALVAHGDVGFHGAPDDVQFSLYDPEYGYYSGEMELIDSGASLALLMGGRVYPMGTMPDSPFQPYAGIGFGLGSVAWEYVSELGEMLDEDSDGFGALLAAVELGGDFKVGSNMTLGVGGRYIYYNWVEESVNETLMASDLSRHSLGLFAHMGFSF